MTWQYLLDLLDGHIEADIRATICDTARQLLHRGLTAAGIPDKHGHDLPRRVGELARTSNMTVTEYSDIILANQCFGRVRKKLKSNQEDDALRSHIHKLAMIWSIDWRVRAGPRINLDQRALEKLHGDSEYQGYLNRARSEDMLLRKGAVGVLYSDFKEALSKLAHKDIGPEGMKALIAYAEKHAMSGGEFSYYERALDIRRGCGKNSDREISPEEAVEAITAFYVFCHYRGATSPTIGTQPDLIAVTKYGTSPPAIQGPRCGTPTPVGTISQEVSRSVSSVTPDSKQSSHQTSAPVSTTFLEVSRSVSSVSSDSRQSSHQTPTPVGTTSLEVSRSISSVTPDSRQSSHQTSTPVRTPSQEVSRPTSSVAERPQVSSGNNAKASSLPPSATSFSDKELASYRINSSGLGYYLKSSLAFLVEFIGVLLRAFTGSWIGFFVFLVLALGTVSSLRRCLNSRKPSDSKANVSKGTGMANPATPVPNYLEAGDELAVKPGEYASDALRVRMNEACKHPVGASELNWHSIYDQQIAIDLIEISCTLGYRPGKIPSPGRIRSPRAFRCPTSNEQPTLSSVEEKFCAKVKQAPQKTRATKPK